MARYQSINKQKYVKPIGSSMLSHSVMMCHDVSHMVLDVGPQMKKGRRQSGAEVSTVALQHLLLEFNPGLLN